jgi:hypothetical protein
MIRDRALQAREKLLGKLPVTGELVRGVLLERTGAAARSARAVKGTWCSF